MARLFDDGSSEYCSYAGAVVSSYPWSFVAWAKTNDGSVNQAIIGLGSATADDNYAFLYFRDPPDDDLRYYISDGGDTSVPTSSSGYSANTWHHVAAVSASSTNHAVYLDGGSKGTDTTDVTPSVDRTVIGARQQNSGLDLFMSGAIAEAAFWDAALTDEEVAALAAGYCPLLIRPDALVAYWPLGGIYGRHDKDLVGGYDMTAYNMPTWADHQTTLIYPNSGIVVPSVAAAPEPSGITVPPIEYYYRRRRAG